MLEDRLVRWFVDSIGHFRISGSPLLTSNYVFLRNVTRARKESALVNAARGLSKQHIGVRVFNHYSAQAEAARSSSSEQVERHRARVGLSASKEIVLKNGGLYVQMCKLNLIS